mgnify:CR=1 FL=1
MKRLTNFFMSNFKICKQLAVNAATTTSRLTLCLHLPSGKNREIHT